MSKYDVRQSFHRAPLVAAIGSVLAAGAFKNGYAQNIVVTTNEDAPVGSITTDCTLRDAIESANTASSVGGCDAGNNVIDVIAFDDELSQSTITLSEGEMEIHAGTYLAIQGPVGPGPYGYGITVHGFNESRLFRIEGEYGAPPGEFQVKLSRLRLTGGKESVDSGFDGSGGAIHARQADLELDHVLVIDNRIEGTSSYTPRPRGGGLYVRNGDLTLDDSLVVGNVTTGDRADGAGIAVVSYISDFGDVTLNNSRLVNNSASGDLTAGGGLYMRDPIGTLTMNNSYVAGNGASGNLSIGGGIKAHNATLINTTVRNNRTNRAGAGLHLSGDNTLINSTVSVNSSFAPAGANVRGGGLDVGNGTVTIINSTISGNSLAAEFSAGAGLALGGGSGSDATLIHSTIADNTVGSDDADGIFISSGSSLTLNNSLVAQTGEDETACNQAADSHTNSLATDNSCTGAATDLGEIALGELDDNGGPTRTHALNEDSAAINAAGNCQIDFDVDQDQRGEPRPGRGSVACDIGAYEFQGEEEDEIFQDRFEERPLMLSTE